VKWRPAAVLVSTVAGVVGVLGFHTRPTTVTEQATGASNGRGAPGSTASSSGSGRSSAGAGRSGRPAAGSHPQGSAGHTSGSTGSSPGSAGAGSVGSGSSAPSSSSGAATRTVRGTVVQYGYGELAVAVTLRAGRITDVTVPTLAVADPTSGQIASEAIPLLRREVLDAQSANISGVSGATYTSEAYAQSVQAALDAARA
jgi:hypothetical protein